MITCDTCHESPCRIRTVLEQWGAWYAIFKLVPSWLCKADSARAEPADSPANMAVTISVFTKTLAGQCYKFQFFYTPIKMTPLLNRSFRVPNPYFLSYANFTRCKIIHVEDIRICRRTKRQLLHNQWSSILLLLDIWQKTSNFEFTSPRLPR